MLRISLLVGLLILSFQDIKEKNISFITLLIITAWCFGTSYKLVGFRNIVTGILCGTVIFAISIITKMLGEGDAIVMGLLCVFLGIYKAGQIILLSLFLASLCSMILLLFKKVNIKTELPFVPFILVGYMGVIICT